MSESNTPSPAPGLEECIEWLLSCQFESAHVIRLKRDSSQWFISAILAHLQSLRPAQPSSATCLNKGCNGNGIYERGHKLCPECPDLQPAPATSAEVHLVADKDLSEQDARLIVGVADSLKKHAKWPCWNHEMPTRDCDFCYAAFRKLFEPSYGKQLESAAAQPAPATTANQCDGCARGLSLDNGLHREANGRTYMACTAEKYAPAQPSLQTIPDAMQTPPAKERARAERAAQPAQTVSELPWPEDAALLRYSLDHNHSDDTTVMVNRELVARVMNTLRAASTTLHAQINSAQRALAETPQRYKVEPPASGLSEEEREALAWAQRVAEDDVVRAVRHSRRTQALDRVATLRQLSTRLGKGT